MINPYEKVDWKTAEQIKSMSHMHATNQERFEQCLTEGYRHFAVTNYQPSVPTYPLDKFFTDIPSGVIGSPNTEKVYTTSFGGGVHICSLGSFAERHGHTSGPLAPWQTVFDEVLSNLQFEDGGGITLNHPGSKNFERYTELLDYDDRVLGIEIFNRCGKKIDGKYFPRFYTDFWDEILTSGRRCWGFAVVDWRMYGIAWGSNVLLVPEFTEHECLRAYRNGNFYMQIKDVGLRFTDITLSEGVLNVAVNRECIIKFITSQGIIKEVCAESASCAVPTDAVFIRVEAIEPRDPDSHILSNPIIF